MPRSRNRFTVCVGLACAAAVVNLTLWRADVLGMADSRWLTALMAVWFVLGWGIGPGCLTALAIRSTDRRLPRSLAPVIAGAAGAALMSGIGWVMHAYLTDPAFMQAAMGASGNADAHSHGHHQMSMDHTAGSGTMSHIGLLTLLVPSLAAVVASVAYAFRPDTGVGVSR
ncbi:hypothetical protein ACWF9G_24425 [Nocardia sp. NPDC055029]